jgi:hypothetical protein
MPRTAEIRGDTKLTPNRCMHSTCTSAFGPLARAGELQGVGRDQAQSASVDPSLPLRIPAKSLSAITVRDEAREVRSDARPQARKNRRCIRWNLDPLQSRSNGYPGLFEAENDADGCTSFAAVERSMSDRLLGPVGPAVVDEEVKFVVGQIE